MGFRRQARECALQILYEWDLTRGEIETIAATYWEVRPNPPEAREFADRLVRATVGNVERIDGLIQRHAEHWRLDRMETVDRNLLRMATAELLSESETPPTVVINEAIEIARRFSTSGSPQFINGLLDSIRRDLEEKEPT